jgi:hypothetical protein
MVGDKYEADDRFGVKLGFLLPWRKILASRIGAGQRCGDRLLPAPIGLLVDRVQLYLVTAKCVGASFAAKLS